MLKELGMEAVAEKILTKKKGRDNILKAVTDYKHATGADIDDFNNDIRAEGKHLEIVLMKDYKKLPPDSVLESLKTAQDSGIFDTFHIAYIVKVKDPILFAKIKAFPNLFFFVDQWGDDVTFAYATGRVDIHHWVVHEVRQREDAEPTAKVNLDFLADKCTKRPDIKKLLLEYYESE